MPLADVLVHSATPVAMVEDGDYIEGERDPEPVEGDSFPCVLFLPLGSEDANPFKPRKISRPTLLYIPVDLDSGAILVELSADDELLISAPELAAWTGAEEARWQVDGQPQPFGPPGRVIGAQAILLQVNDG